MTNIRNIKSRAKNAVLLLTLAALWLVSASFFVGPDAAALPACSPGTVCYYVAINPIDVCTDTGTNCAPFNNLSSVGNPGAATSTTPIGFVDSGTGSSNTGKDITRAMLNQIGVDIVWGPIRQFNSTKYQTLNVVTCGSLTSLNPPPNPLPTCATQNPSFLTSVDFLTLSQQPAISTGPYPITKNPPGVPVSSQPTMINMFFVNTLNPPSPGTLYGFSWINNNGIAIGKNTFVPPSRVQKPRPDTIGHELFHNLGGDHTIFGAGPGAPYNLMTSGDLRTEPQSTSSTSTTGALYELAHTTADQLTLTSAAVPPPPNQQDAADASGFLNPIAISTTTATATSSPTTTTALAVTTAGAFTSITAVPGKNKPNTSIFFDVVGPSQGRPDETLIGLTLTLYPGVKFDPSNKARFTSNGQLVVDADYDRGGRRDRDCPIAHTKCLIIDLKNPGLAIGQDLRFSQGIIKSQGNDDDDDDGSKIADNRGKQPVCLSDLTTAGITITYRFSDGLVITSDLTGQGGPAGPNCAGDPPVLTADSQHPSATVPAQIDPIQFTSADGALPCTPVPPPPPSILIAGPDAAILSCPDPTATPVGDGDPRYEGGQLPPTSPN